MRLPPKMPQRAMVRIWVASLHQELQRLRDAGVSVLSKNLQSAAKGGFEQHRPAEKSGGEKSPCGAFLDVRLGVIHPRPPKKLNVLRCVELFVFPPAFSNAGGWIRTAAATSLKTAQKQPSGQRRRPPPKGGNREEPLGLRSAGRPCRPRHEADAGNPQPRFPAFMRLGAIHPRPPNKKNPNLFPIGEGFGFFVFFGYDSNSHI